MKHIPSSLPGHQRPGSGLTRPAARLRQRCVPLRVLPAGLLALGLALEGCGERPESPLEPVATMATAPAAASLDAVFQADKARNAVNLGPPTAAASSALDAQSVSTAAATGNSIPFAPKPGPFANTVSSDCDDCVFEGLPIGFSFTFFGNTYTNFSISSNGFIGFTPGMPHGCCAGGAIPSAGSPNNIIAAAWTDLYPPGGGGIFYETRGQAPNRFLVVAYQNLSWCCEFGGNRVTTQIVLYEGSNAIEIHTANQSVGHIYTQGVEDANGFQASFLAGRVAANYGLTRDAVRFTTFGNVWTGRAPLPSPRQRPAVAAAGGLLYAIGGLNGAGTALTSVMAYTPGSNSWSTKAALPAARYGGNGAAAISSKLYLAGGSNSVGALTRSLYAYNPSTGTWATKANMPVASGCGGSVAIGGKLYVFTGCTLLSTGGQVSVGLLHRYDPSINTWAALRAAPEAHFQPAVAAIGGKIYVAGGGNGSGATSGRLDVYDPATNTWTTLGAMPTARVAAAGAAAGGLLYVVGGRSGTTYLSTVEAYNPVTDSWVVRAAVPTRRAGLGVSLISSDGRLYAIGGRNSTSVLATNERYTP
jgi:N-acetylneuraminic acid mutarotase